MVKRFRQTESYKIKQIIFAVIVILIIFVAWLILQKKELIAPYIAAIVLAVVFLFIIWRYDFLLTMKEYERAVIYTFGRVSRVGGPGWALLFPMIESFKIVDLRTSTIDIEPQEVVTADKIRLSVDAVIYLYVNKDKQSVINSVIEIDDYKHGAELYVKSSIRDVIGSLTMSEVIANIEKLNNEVKEKLVQVTASWGVSIESVEITNVTIPPEVISAMHEQKAAEQRKFAIMERAQAKRYEIDAVRDAADKLTEKSLSYYYIRALEKMADGQATKIIFPIEASKFAEALTGRLSPGKAEGTSKSLSLEDIGAYAGMFKEYMDSMKQKKEAKKKGKKK